MIVLCICLFFSFLCPFPLLPPPFPAEGGTLIGGSDFKLIYRHYATLYFVFCVDSSESELGILDLIQVSSYFMDYWVSHCTVYRVKYCDLLVMRSIQLLKDHHAVLYLLLPSITITARAFFHHGRYVRLRGSTSGPIRNCSMIERRLNLSDHRRTGAVNGVRLTVMRQWTVKKCYIWFFKKNHLAWSLIMWK